MKVGYFSKSLMTNRILKWGSNDLLTPDVVATMDMLNGKEVDDYCWDNVVLGENFGICDGITVNLDDVAKTLIEWECLERKNVG